MSRNFSTHRPTVGGLLPKNQYGRLVGQFEFSSHVPLRGGQNTGRHLYIAAKIPSGPDAGVFECAVNIRSDDQTEVQYCQRTEDLSQSAPPDFGFDGQATLSYGSSSAHPQDPSFMGLKDSDFAAITNDDLYNKIADQMQNCDRLAAYGMTYSGGDGIHDLHMNSGENGQPGRVHHDGAIVFYFNMNSGGQSAAFANWFFVKFEDASVVNF
jgi:hypothetical protein